MKTVISFFDTKYIFSKRQLKNEDYFPLCAENALNFIILPVF